MKKTVLHLLQGVNLKTHYDLVTGQRILVHVEDGVQDFVRGRGYHDSDQENKLAKRYQKETIKMKEVDVLKTWIGGRIRGFPEGDNSVESQPLGTGLDIPGLVQKPRQWRGGSRKRSDAEKAMRGVHGRNVYDEQQRRGEDYYTRLKAEIERGGGTLEHTTRGGWRASFPDGSSLLADRGDRGTSIARQVPRTPESPAEVKVVDHKSLGRSNRNTRLPKRRGGDEDGNPYEDIVRSGDRPGNPYDKF